MESGMGGRYIHYQGGGGGFKGGEVPVWLSEMLRRDASTGENDKAGFVFFYRQVDSFAE